LHMAQLMPLPLTVSCFSKIQIGFTFLVPAHLGSPGKGPLNGGVCVCVILCWVDMTSMRGAEDVEWVVGDGPIHVKNINSLAKTCRDAGTADTWTPVIDAPVIDAGTAVQRICHAPWTTSVVKLIRR